MHATTRYTVVKVDRPPDPDFHRPRNGPGWRIHDADGTRYPTPLVGRRPGLTGWFARKRDAVRHCANLNRWAEA